MTKVFEKLTIRDSFMFDCVMADRTICRQFLSVLQQKDVGELVNLETEREFRMTVDGKAIKLDIYAEEGQDRVYDTEMEQLNHRKVETKHLPERTRFYQSVLDQSLLAKGQPYSAIKECVIIFVCTFDPFGKGRYVYTFRNICVEDNSLELNDRCTKIFFNTKSEAPDVPKEIRNLFDYINEGSVSDRFTESLDSSVRDVRSNERWKREYMHNFTEKQDIWEEAHETGVNEGIELGREQGIELGREQGIELGREQGIELGREQGIELGREQGVELSIEQMLRAGKTPEQIADFCGYELSKVRKVQQNQNI